MMFITKSIMPTINKLIKVASLLCVINSVPAIYALEQELSGLIDFRYTSTDSFDSYIKGGYGKFRYSDGNKVSLAQLALHYKLDWENNFSFHLITNAYGDDENNNIGITESYLKYLSIPTDKGYRYQFRAGFMYPKISLENNATGWSSPYTLSYSTMNTWIGEEVKHIGLETSVTKLGKFSGDAFDLTLDLSLFTHNDPNGSMLSWHGWTQSSRQSFWNEKLDFPHFPALYPGQALENQARQSDPFLELDSNVGYHINGEWNLRRKVKLSLGYYDNRGGVDIVENGQYDWQTKFSHIGVKWQLSNDLLLIAQQMSGDTRMRVVGNLDVVAINFNNACVLLSKKWDAHRITARIEKFDVEDIDHITGDDNNEDGKSATLSYAYRMNKNFFVHLEYNWIDSNRFSRYYHHLETDTTESQFQLAGRYYF